MKVLRNTEINITYIHYLNFAVLLRSCIHRVRLIGCSVFDLFDQCVVMVKCFPLLGWDHWNV